MSFNNKEILNLIQYPINRLTIHKDYGEIIIRSLTLKETIIQDVNIQYLVENCIIEPKINYKLFKTFPEKISEKIIEAIQYISLIKQKGIELLNLELDTKKNNELKILINSSQRSGISISKMFGLENGIYNWEYMIWGIVK